jgi:periplasmic divalent cation tolerance protein
MTEFIIIFVTAGSAAEAETIAKTLIEEQLAACVNILPPIRSIYRWEGKLTDDQEWLVLIKTRAERFSAVEARVKALHSYQIPEVIALPIVQGAAGYLRWLLESVSEPQS